MASTYGELYDEVVELYRAKHYAEALDLLVKEADSFPEHASMTRYLRACMAVRADKVDLALDFLNEALDRGIWYSEQFLRDTPSFQPLLGTPRFEAVIGSFARRYAEVGADARAALLVNVPGGDSGRK